MERKQTGSGAERACGTKHRRAHERCRAGDNRHAAEVALVRIESAAGHYGCEVAGRGHGLRIVCGRPAGEFGKWKNGDASGVVGRAVRDESALWKADGECRVRHDAGLVRDSRVTVEPRGKIEREDPCACCLT